MKPGFKNKVALTGAALAAAAFAGGAYAATQSGSGSRQQFLNDVAHRLNVTPDQLRAALKGAMIDRINEAVKDGWLTQAQADKLEQRINQGQLPMAPGLGAFGGPRFGGPGLGGPGFGGPGFGGPRFRHPIVNVELAAAAGYLGLTESQLVDQLSSGKSLAQVAKDKGKTTAGLEQAMTAAFKSRLDKAVSAGRITQSQEQAALKWFQARLDKRVNHGLKFGVVHGGRGAFPGAPGGPGRPGGWAGPGGWGGPPGSGGPGGPGAPGGPDTPGGQGGTTHPSFEGPQAPPPAA